MKESTKELIKKKNIRRNRQLAHLMIKNHRFQEAIADLRKKLGMPSDGFTDQKSCQSYYNKKAKEFKNKKLPDLRSRVGATILGKFGFYLISEIHVILSCRAFMYNLEKAVEYYLYYNELPEDDSYFLSLPYCNDYPDEFSGKNIKLAIIIDDSTTIEEVKSIWPQVMRQQRFRKLGMPIKQTKKFDIKNMFEVLDSYKRKPQFKEMKNIERDELIVRLRKDGLSGKQIQRKITDSGYGVIGYEYVSKIIKRYDVKRGIRKA